MWGRGGEGGKEGEKRGRKKIREEGERKTKNEED